MILDTLITVGAFTAKAACKTVEVATPLVVKGSSKVATFGRTEVAKAKEESAKQAKLIKESYANASKALNASADDFMADWNKKIQLA